MRIGICEDEKQVRELLAEVVLKTQQSIVVEEFSDGEALLNYFSKGNMVDVLFLDIHFGEKTNGIHIAKRLRGKSASVMKLPLIVFITGYPEYMPEAFSLHAYQYLVKPVSETEFLKVLQAACKEAEKIRYLCGEEKLKIQIAGNTLMIPVRDILYLESFGRKICIHRREDTVEFYGKLSDVEKEFSGRFCKIHRCFLVNLEYVYSYGRTQIIMENGEILPISKYRHEDFLKSYMTWMAAEY